MTEFLNKNLYKKINTMEDPLEVGLGIPPHLQRILRPRGEEDQRPGCHGPKELPVWGAPAFGVGLGSGGNQIPWLTSEPLQKGKLLASLL